MEPAGYSVGFVLAIAIVAIVAGLIVGLLLGRRTSGAARRYRDIALKLHDAIIKTVNTPAVRERLLSVGADPLTMSIEEFTEYIRKDIEKWRKVVKAANLTFDR